MWEKVRSRQWAPVVLVLGLIGLLVAGWVELRSDQSVDWTAIGVAGTAMLALVAILDQRDEKVRAGLDEARRVAYIALAVCRRSGGAVDLGPELEATLLNTLVHQHCLLSIDEAENLFRHLRTDAASSEAVMRLRYLSAELSRRLGESVDPEAILAVAVGDDLSRRHQ